MRISDWSSDVCSSDLRVAVHSDASFARLLVGRSMAHRRSPTTGLQGADTRSTGSMVATRASGRAVTSASISPPNKRWLIVEHASPAAAEPASQSASSGHAASPGDRKDRKSVVEGQSVAVRVELGGRRTLRNKNEK